MILRKKGVRLSSKVLQGLPADPLFPCNRNHEPPVRGYRLGAAVIPGEERGGGPRPVVPAYDFEGIGYFPAGKKEGFEVMIPVRTLSEYVQPEVDLDMRIGDHETNISILFDMEPR